MRCIDVAQKYKIFFILLLPLFLTACPSNQDYFGTGPLTRSSRMETAFDRYKNSGISASYFAITEDGRRAGWSYCPAGECGGNSLMLAIHTCEDKSGSHECRIYAEGPTVVWDTSKPTGNNP
jgi:hypothetical protein